MDEALDTINALRRQEEQYYDSSSYTYSNGKSTGPDWNCRRKMAAWCVQVVQFCNLSLETAEIAMCVLDCFLATRGGESARRCRDQYRLACMACLYTSIKNTEAQALHSKTFSELSQGAYSVRDIEQAELSILTWLNWRVNPPTVMAFVREMIHVLPTSLEETTRKELHDLTAMQIERGFGAVVASPSVIAFAAFMNSLALVSTEKESKELMHISQTMANLLKVDYSSEKLLETQSVLFHMIPKHGKHVSSSVLSDKDRSCSKSPVTYGYNSPRSVTG